MCMPAEVESVATLPHPPLLQIVWRERLLPHELSRQIVYSSQGKEIVCFSTKPNIDDFGITVGTQYETTLSLKGVGRIRRKTCTTPVLAQAKARTLTQLYHEAVVRTRT